MEKIKVTIEIGADRLAELQSFLLGTPINIDLELPLKTPAKQSKTPANQEKAPQKQEGATLEDAKAVVVPFIKESPDNFNKVKAKITELGADKLANLEEFETIIAYVNELKG